MFITTLSINVGRSRANRSLVMDVFSFVDLLFILEPPSDGDGGCIIHDCVDFDLFSFVLGSGVEVFVRSSVSGLMEVVSHDRMTACVSYVDCGKTRMIGGVYVHPQIVMEDWSEAVLAWNGCQLLCGDFNARHPRWDMGCGQPNSLG